MQCKLVMFGHPFHSVDTNDTNTYFTTATLGLGQPPPRCAPLFRLQLTYTLCGAVKEKVATYQKANQDSNITQCSGVVGVSLSELHMYIWDVWCWVLYYILYVYNIIIYYTLVH